MDSDTHPRMDFDIDAFLAAPRTAHLATAGPTVRPVWFLWERGAFWTLTGPWSTVPARVGADPRIAIVVDCCDVASGRVRQVAARGRGELLDLDTERARRKLTRYLGGDDREWDDRFRGILHDDPAVSGVRWLRLAPDRISASDLSYRAHAGAPRPGAPLA